MTKVTGGDEVESQLKRRPLSRLAAVAVLMMCGLWVTACGGSSKTSSTKAASAAPSNAVKVGILSDCQGAFGAFYQDDIGGAQAYLIAHTGAKPNGPSPTDGITGGTIGGRPIQIVGYGCSNDNADKALAEARRLVEQNGADILIGPLSGDEGIAVANYSKTQPGKTFINGTSGAQDTTLKVRSPNFYRFNGDGAQWNAGVGDYVYRHLGWRKAVVVADDYGFGWTSAAGFIADFCAAGGTVTRIFPPLNTTDYSSYVAQVPKSFDGLFSAVGGSGLLAFMKQYNQARGPFPKNKFAGNIFVNDPKLLAAIGSQLIGAYAGGPTNEDTKSPNAAAYIAALTQAYPNIPQEGSLAKAASSVFTINYYAGMWALDKALTQVKGDLSNGQAALHAALAKTSLPDAPYGPITLDANRQAIVNNYIAQVTPPPAGAKVPGFKTVLAVPNVNQTFGGSFSASTPPPGRTAPACQKRSLPWQGKEKAIKVS
jgi:branched-chain amino acid transport system substrate-binding protein